MPKYKCIIVDDEPIAIRVIKNHLSHFEDFEIVAECSNAIDALKVLREQRADLIFLDIEMPTLTGLDMLKAGSVEPEVIFTTAHRFYAVDAFEVNALDYLLKPISFERFALAIMRFLKMNPIIKTAHQSEQVQDWIMIKADKKNYKVQFADILYIESMADYVVVHLHNKKLITKERISQLNSELPESLFIRVHRGFIVNIEKVAAWYGNIIEVGHVKIPVGRSYKDQVAAIYTKP